MELYCVNCMPLKDRMAEALALLPQQLRVRAEVYRRQDDQLRSVAASLLLLRILGTEQTRALEYGHAGKPFLSGGPEFNLSHSGTYAVDVYKRQSYKCACASKILSGRKSAKIFAAS